MVGDSSDLNAHMEASIRILFRWTVSVLEWKESTYRVNYYVKTIDNSLPRLPYDSYGLNEKQIFYYQRPVSVTTPALTITTYDFGHTHELYAVPDGLWHFNDCAGSKAQTMSCLANQFIQYKLTATYANRKFTFEYQANRREMVDNHNVRFVHVIFDAG